jgi:WD40 repeat protein
VLRGHNAREGHPSTGYHIATCGHGRLWETSTGMLIAVLERHFSGVYGVALFASDDLLASGGIDGTVRLRDTDTCQPVAALAGVGE